ncbi:MAG TPA: glycosyltransferase family 4 protein [Acetobacteraceae bacterium]|nr:glycosyltransferase family 4 protein [Acetobacteraceae bacterium]
MKRLVIVSPHYPEYVIEYARAMARHYEVLLILDDRHIADEYGGRSVPEDATRLIRTNQFRTPLDLLRLAWDVVRFRPSIVHFQEAAGPRRAFFSALVALVMKPFAEIVLTVHDPTPHLGRDEEIRRRCAPMLAVVRRLADVVVLHGAFCAREYRRLRVAAQKVVVSAHGAVLAPAQAGRPHGCRLNIYFFGRMEAYKGLDVLLRALRIMHEEGLDFRLVMAGQGPELDRLEEGFRELPEVTVRKGYVRSDEIVRGIQEAECVVLPYLSATQSGVVTAAFAGERYVVASETGGLMDIVRHGQNGLLVPPGDPRALAAAFRTLFAEPGLRERLLEGARETAETQLDWNRITDDLHRQLAAPA